MQREIKFRGKRVDGGGWVYGDLYTYQGKLMISNEVVVAPSMQDPCGDHVFNSYEVIPETVGQFTGVKDKNGVDIYEGDVVKVLYTDWPSKSSGDPRTLDEYLSDISTIMVVIYSFNGFYISTELDGYAETMEVGRYGMIQVIGNLTDNPQLLTK